MKHGPPIQWQKHQLLRGLNKGYRDCLQYIEPDFSIENIVYLLRDADDATRRENEKIIATAASSNILASAPVARPALVVPVALPLITILLPRRSSDAQQRRHHPQQQPQQTKISAPRTIKINIKNSSSAATKIISMPSSHQLQRPSSVATRPDASVPVGTTSTIPAERRIVAAADRDRPITKDEDDHHRIGYRKIDINNGDRIIDRRTAAMEDDSAASANGASASTISATGDKKIATPSALSSTVLSSRTRPSQPQLPHQAFSSLVAAAARSDFAISIASSSAESSSTLAQQ